jgi:hypothetical protein
MPDTATPSPTLLRAGPLTLALDRGELRWLRLGGREVLRAIYAAVRPPDWSTVPAVLENLRVDAGTDRFEIRFDAVNRADPLWLEWTGRLEGTPDGRVRFEMDAVARSTFLRNRIGLCVLHPMEECAGAACSVESTDGTVTDGAFPRLVSPHQPFLDLRAVRHEVAPGVEAEVRFEGDVFEMEDQRNWSDASFKTYSTPLALPMPVEVRDGERIRQVVTLTLHGQVEGGRVAPSVRRGWLAEDAVNVEVDASESWPAPRVGHGLGASRPGPEAMDRIRALAPAHLRVDLRPGQDGWEETLAVAAEVARECGTGLEVAALVSAGTAGIELARLAEGARVVDAPVDAWLVFDAESQITSPGLAATARERLLDHSGGSAAILGGGTNGFFAELNRGRGAAEGLDLVCLPASPQVHAFDDATVIENTTSFSSMARTARAFAGETPLALSPVTLRPRPATDPRQATMFAAGWTLGLLAAATEAGFGRITLFELEGPGGLMEKGRIFPAGHLLAELAMLAGSAPDARVVRARPSDPWRCLALAVRAGRLLRVYVFNPTPRPQDVVVAGLPAQAWQRSFRATPSGGAGLGPGATTGQKVTGANGVFALSLDGHEILALDAELEDS